MNVANYTCNGSAVLHLLNTSLNDTFTSASSVIPREDKFTEVIETVVLVLFVFLTVFGFLGNMLVILVVVTDKELKQPTYMLVFNLAIADLLFILICVPFTAVRYASPTWIFGDAWCRMVNYLTIICAWGSAYTLMLMCIDRLIAIVFAIRFNKFRTRRNVMVVIGIVWISIFLANIPTWMYHGEMRYYRDEIARKTCIFLHSVDEHSRKIYQLANFLFGFLLPVMVMAILYSIIIAYLMSRSAPGNSSTNIRRNRRVAKMVVTVVVVFVICWLPIHVILIMGNYGVYKRSKTHVAIQIGANCLAYMNSCMNPVLYTMSSSVFRESFKKFLFNLKCCKAIRHSSSNEQSRKNSPNATEVIQPFSSSEVETQLVHANGSKEKKPFLPANV